MRAAPETRLLYVATLREVERVARANGIALPDGVAAALLAQTDAFEASGKSSMLRDAEAGRPLEIDALFGRVASLGGDSGVATPLADFLYAALAPAHRRAMAGRSG